MNGWARPRPVRSGRIPRPSRTSRPSGTKLKKPTSSPSSSTTARRCVRRAGLAKSSTRRGSAEVSYHSYGNSYRHSAMAAACSSVSGTTFTAASLRSPRSARQRPGRGAPPPRPTRRAGTRRRTRRPPRRVDHLRRRRRELVRRAGSQNAAAAVAALHDGEGRRRRGRRCEAEQRPLRLGREEQVGRQLSQELAEARRPVAADLGPGRGVDRDAGAACPREPRRAERGRADRLLEERVAGDVEDVAREPARVELLRRERGRHTPVGGERALARVHDGDDDAGRAPGQRAGELDAARGELPRQQLAGRVAAPLGEAARLRSERGRPGRDVRSLAAGSRPDGGTNVAARGQRLLEPDDHVEHHVAERHDPQGTIEPWTRMPGAAERATSCSGASWAPPRPWPPSAGGGLRGGASNDPRSRRTSPPSKARPASRSWRPSARGTAGGEPLGRPRPSATMLTSMARPARLLPLCALLAAVGVLVAPGPAAARQQPLGASFRVIVLGRIDSATFASLAERGAVGLLRPGFGPTTSRRSALAELVRGAEVNARLGGVPPGRPLIGVSKARVFPNCHMCIVLQLPPRGTSANDRLYPIAVIGRNYHGLLTSPTTHIPGLVSIVDIAPTALGMGHAATSLSWTPAHDSLARLASLGHAIDANNRLKFPVLFILAGLLLVLALAGVRAAATAIPAALLVNLALGVAQVSNEVVLCAAVSAGTLLVALALARVCRGDGALLALFGGVVGLYALVMATRPEWQAINPFGPTQNSRFWGIGNQVETLLLAPLLAGALLARRRFGLLGFALFGLFGLFVITDNRLGADGGGAIVLGVALAVLGTRLFPRSLRLRRAARL